MGLPKDLLPGSIAGWGGWCLETWHRSSRYALPKVACAVRGPRGYSFADAPKPLGRSSPRDRVTRPSIAAGAVTDLACPGPPQNPLLELLRFCSEHARGSRSRLISAHVILSASQVRVTQVSASSPFQPAPVQLTHVDPAVTHVLPPDPMIARSGSLFV